VVCFFFVFSHHFFLFVFFCIFVGFFKICGFWRGVGFLPPRLAVAPVTDYSVLDTWLFSPPADCSTFNFHRPAPATDLTRPLALHALRSLWIAPRSALYVRVDHRLLRVQHLRASSRLRIAPSPILCASCRSQIAPRSTCCTPRRSWIAPMLALDAP
jgi:hypothetical protein